MCELLPTHPALDAQPPSHHPLGVSRGHSQMAVTPGAAFSLLFFNSGLLETEEWSAGS